MAKEKPSFINSEKEAADFIEVFGAREHNLKNIDIKNSTCNATIKG